jgi:hypothetical protein
MIDPDLRHSPTQLATWQKSMGHRLRLHFLGKGQHMDTANDPQRGIPLNTILALNAARTVPLSRYEEEGNFDRFGYIRDLADNHGADLAAVIVMAELLGPEEDFDGLVTTIEDAAEGFGFGAIFSGEA